MDKANKFIAILEENTPLREDVDLFYLEMPLEKSGLWFSDRQIDSRFNGTGAQEFDIYYRGKDKTKLIANTTYLKDVIDTLTDCRLEDGEDFRLDILFTWDYLEKDSEGYFVFANAVRVL